MGFTPDELVKKLNRSVLETLCRCLLYKRENDGLNGRLWDANKHLAWEDRANYILSEHEYLEHLFERKTIMNRDINSDLSKLADAFFENLQIDNCEFGGIGLDSKRPFGNSSVECDMLEIIGIDAEFKCPNCGDQYSEKQYDYVRKLYHEKLIPFLQSQHNQSQTD